MTDYESDHAFPATAAAENAMGFQANRTICLKDDTHTGFNGTVLMAPEERPSLEMNHRHVAIEWEGGVLWLDQSDLGDHYCIDVRWFDSEGNERPIGIMAIEGGRRIELDNSKVPDEALIFNHGFPAAHMPIMMVDKESK